MPELLERAKKLKVNAGDQPGADLGPLISPEAKQRVCDLVQSGADEGASVKTSRAWGPFINRVLFLSLLSD